MVFNMEHPDHQVITAHLPCEAVGSAYNHFVCTLDRAAILNAERPHSFKTVNDFIHHQSCKQPTRPAVGFPVPPKDKGSDQQWKYTVYSDKNTADILGRKG